VEGFLLRDTELLRDRALVAGEWITADDGATLEVVNPARREAFCTVPALGAAETRRAIATAEQAGAEWRRRTCRERSAVLRYWFQLVTAASEDVAMIMSAENGKPLAEAKAEVAYAANFLDWYADEAKRTYGRIVPEPLPDRRVLVLKQPIGVCVGITPWNFPAAMILREAAPALAAGCSIVMKPAEQTPLTALALGALAERAGVPPGVLSIVTGPPAPIGEEMTANPAVRKIGFTGSNAVGKLLARQAADTVKKVSLELGGSAPFIVFEDADLELALDNAMLAKFRNNGQTCVSANRFLVHERLHDAFVEGYVQRVQALRVGDALADPDATQGPMIDQQGFDKVVRHVEHALDQGAGAAAGARPSPAGGWFYEPTVLTGVEPEMLVAREETFGPVAPVMRFGSEEEAVELANATPFGLLAYFFTRDVGRAWRVGEALEFGMVGHNTGILATDAAPMGGLKESGLGRVGGVEGIEEYLETKYFTMSGMGR